MKRDCRFFNIMNIKEIESKFYVRDLARIEERLRSLNARLVQSRVHERNLRFDTVGQELRSGLRVLRIRQDARASITYKGPSENAAGVLSRTEIELTVEGFNEARALLEALGFVVQFYYEKYRTTFELDGAFIMLDELPYGTFVEIEGKDAEDIHRMAEKIGLRWDGILDMGYHMIFERICKVRGLNLRDLRFEDFKGMETSIEDLKIPAADG
jgi:adenylate cyclase class 2